MKIKNKSIAFLFCLLLLLFGNLSLVSCIHESGHINFNSPSPIPARNKAHSNDIQISRNDDNIKLSGSEVFSKYNNAVFTIVTLVNQYSGYQGSGFFINDSGLAVSNYHVFKGTRKGVEMIKLANSDEVYKVAEVIAYSAKDDFIVFRVDITNNQFIPIADRRPLVGERVFAIGSPKGLVNTFSSGEISQWRGNIIQIDVPIDHGSSGGALINEYGEVVGITSGTFDDVSKANLNYALSIDVIKKSISQ